MAFAWILIFQFLSSVRFSWCSLEPAATDSTTAFVGVESSTVGYEIHPLLPTVEEDEESSAQSQYISDGIAGEDRENNNLLADEDVAPGHLAEDMENLSDSGCLSLVECPDDKTSEPKNPDSQVVDNLSTASEEHFPASSDEPQITHPSEVATASSEANDFSTEVAVSKARGTSSESDAQLKFIATTPVTPSEVKDISGDVIKNTEFTNVNNDILHRPTKFGTSTTAIESNESDFSTGYRRKHGKKQKVPKHESSLSLTEMFSETTPTTSTQEITIIVNSSANYSEPHVTSTTVAQQTFPDPLTVRMSSTLASGVGEGDVASIVPFTTATSRPIQPKLTNPSCALLPVCVKVRVASEPPLCGSQSSHESEMFREIVARSVARYVSHKIIEDQVVLEMDPCSPQTALSSSSDILFFVTDSSGEYEEIITAFSGIIMKKIAKKPTVANDSLQVMGVEVIESGESDYGVPVPASTVPHAGIIAAVAISAVAGACLCLLCILLLIMKHRLAMRQRPVEASSALDNYSLDSFAVNASFRRRLRTDLNGSSFINHAFANDDCSELPSKSMTVTELANLLHHHRNNIAREFEKLPMNMPKLDKVPVGAEVKNRYANVVPNPVTRVLLSDVSDDPVKSYINANYVKGHNGKAQFYVACQSPLPEYAADFWKMVWEQQSRLIIMLTLLEENGVSRCAPYFPESTLDFRQQHDNYEVSLVKKDVREFYTASTFRLLELQKNLFRDVLHLWYRAWPAVGVPSDPSSLVTFLLQARRFINCNSGPTIVHCSAGTGRTGVLIALDICMRQYEESRHVDVLRCVSKIRLDRGGAVQNKDQYILIHEALLEYASCIANQSNRPSIVSSAQ